MSYMVRQLLHEAPEDENQNQAPTDAPADAEQEAPAEDDAPAEDEGGDVEGGLPHPRPHPGRASY